MNHRRSACIVLAAFALVPTGAALAQDKSIVVASTTSTEQSGLFGHLLPAFKKDSGIDVRVVAVGTGQALDMGRRGDADAVFNGIAHRVDLAASQLARGLLDAHALLDQCF